MQNAIMHAPGESDDRVLQSPLLKISCNIASQHGQVKSPFTHDNHNQSQATCSDAWKYRKRTCLPTKGGVMHMQPLPACSIICSTCRKDFLENYSPSLHLVD